MTITEKANKVIDIFFKFHLDSHKLIENIQSVCTSRGECSQWYLFTPLVFTMVNYPEVHFPDEYHISNAEGHDEILKFSDSEVFNELVNVVQANWNSFAVEDREQVMFNYHQYHNITDAIRSGVNASDIDVKKVKII